MAAADFNNDGNMDFIAGGNADDLYLFAGNGTGGFTTTTITTNAAGSFGRGKDAGDINEDGNWDFTYCENPGGGIYAYYGDGNGGFTETFLFDQIGNNDPYACVLADFDGDG